MLSLVSWPSLIRIYNLDYRAATFGCFELIVAILCLSFFVVIEADPMCDFIAATNIQSRTGYSQWSCTTAGITSTPPCSSPIWPGLTCSGSNVLSIIIVNQGLYGKCTYLH